MQQAKKDALLLSNYFAPLPHPAKSLLSIIAISFLFGIFFGVANKSQLGSFELFALGVGGIFVLAAPAILSALGLFLMRRKATFRRSIFIALISTVIYGLSYSASFLFEPIGAWAHNIIFVGFALSFGIWFFALYLVLDFRRSAFIFATMQMIFFALFFLAYGGSPAYLDFPGMLMKIYFASFVLLAALYLALYFVSAPLKKNLGVSLL